MNKWVILNRKPRLGWGFLHRGVLTATFMRKLKMAQRWEADCATRKYRSEYQKHKAFSRPLAYKVYLN